MCTYVRYWRNFLFLSKKTSLSQADFHCKPLSYVSIGDYGNLCLNVKGSYNTVNLGVYTDCSNHFLHGLMPYRIEGSLEVNEMKM